MTKSLTRRIIAIIFAACGAGVLTWGTLQGQIEALTALVASLNMVLGFYFGAVANK